MSDGKASDTKRDEAYFNAVLAEQTERYEDMIAAVKDLAQLGEPLSVDERNLLSVAYKNVVGAGRAAWRVINTIVAKQEDSGEDTKLSVGYRAKIEKDLAGKCNELLDLVHNDLLPSEKTAEGNVFYLKMAGDYYRYLAEFQRGGDRDAAIKKATEEYAKATDEASSGLTPTNAIRLGLALNYSVFHYEILGDPTTAIDTAKTAFEEAIPKLESLAGEEEYKDASLIMQLIKDNLNLWGPDAEDADDAEPVTNDGTTVEDL